MKTINIVISTAVLLLMQHAISAAPVAQKPLFVQDDAPPLVMITMGKNHKLYYEAYNDAADLDGDGQLDIRYIPKLGDTGYFGYFDSKICYDHDGTKFTPKSVTSSEVAYTCGPAGSKGTLWSGDFLNYMTTTRVDALRKVLYGGTRTVDDVVTSDGGSSSTVLKRSFIPKDAHSWVKAYEGFDIEGYHIEQYAPNLLDPVPGTNHLFANVTEEEGGEPLFRVLNDSPHKKWEWASKERPVAGERCIDANSTEMACEKGAVTTGFVVPNTMFSGPLTRKVYDLPAGFSHPQNHAEYNTLVSTYGVADNLLLEDTIENIYHISDVVDNKLTVITGEIIVPTAGVYTFAVDGDDAVELVIAGVSVGFYDGHAPCNCDTHTLEVFLSQGATPFVYRHEEAAGGEAYALKIIESRPASVRKDYAVNVEVCTPAFHDDDSCKAYIDGSYQNFKPTGLLQEYGEDGRMAFGLLTGSFPKNLSGGVVRKNISTFSDEVDLVTGKFSTVDGIVNNIDKLKITQFQYPNTADWEYTAGWKTDGAISDAGSPPDDSNAQDWGNPIAEMMYEGLRYFSGQDKPTKEFFVDTKDSPLKLASPEWLDPYRETGGYSECATPVQLVISDINVSYDSDQLPGSRSGWADGTVSNASDLPGSGLDVSDQANAIWADEYGTTQQFFIGETSSNSDGTPTPKEASSFADIRGLTPEEPTKQGSYYSASIARYGRTEDIHDVVEEQNVETFAVVLASPLPRIEIPVAGRIVTLVPFAKSVNGAGINSAKGEFQPTNQIVDFYVNQISNTGDTIDETINGGLPYGKFSINFEDVEQAADHDMDAIVEYEFIVNDNGTSSDKSDDTVTINLDSTYAYGGIAQHIGYVISGTEKTDGTYLEVRDDDPINEDKNYYLDTRPGDLPSPKNSNWDSTGSLPLQASRTFTPGKKATAKYVEHDPLWYAAKYGTDIEKWDDNKDSIPDNYFKVTNASTLREQLRKAFSEIEELTTDTASFPTSSSRLQSNTAIFEGEFYTKDWSGDIIAYKLIQAADVDTGSGSLIGTVGEQKFKVSDGVPAAADRTIFTYNRSTNTGIEFTYEELTTPAPGLLNGGQDLLSSASIDEDKKIISFIRGNNVDGYRTRGVNKIGDIVNSSVTYVGKTDDYGYSALAGDEGTEYTTFIAKNTADRNDRLYFGANDGMLHAVSADTGEEYFTYIPETVAGNLKLLTDPNYGCTLSGCVPHQYFVDATPIVGDVYDSTHATDKWRTLLVGTLGAGGKGLFALDITDSTFDGTNVMWEISTTAAMRGTDLVTTVASDADFSTNLGYTLPSPSIVRMHNGNWAAIVANGYDSVDKTAALFIIDITNGEIIRSFNTGVGSAAAPNGLSTPIAIDYDGDSITDFIYAGDLQGNLWKFDVTGKTKGSWNIAHNEPLFVAKDLKGDIQPITAKPDVGFHPEGGLLVYFGTGKYFELGDHSNTETQTQTFYAIRDNNEVVGDRGDLQVQKINSEFKDKERTDDTSATNNILRKTPS